MNELEKFLFVACREIGKEQKDMKAYRFRNAISLINTFIEACPEENPNWAVAVNNRAYCNLFLANYDSGISDLRLLEAVDSDRYNLHVNYSAVLDDLMRYDAALEHAQKAILLSSKPFEAYANLAAVQCSLKQYEKAVESATKSMEICLNGKANTNRGLIYVKLGEFEKAGEDLKKACSQNPDSLATHANLGEFYLITGEENTAREKFESVLSKVASFDQKNRSIRHYFPAITAENGMKKLGIDSGTDFSSEARDFGIPSHFFED